MNVKVKNQIFKKIVYALSSISIFSLLSITLFLLIKALPLFKEYNIFSFIFGTKWYPSEQLFGIGGFIVASILTTILAVVIALPIGLYCALFIHEVLPKKVGNSVLFVMELLAGIPSIIFGFFGINFVAPLIQQMFGLSSGLGVFTTSLILAFMVLPNMIVLTVASLHLVDPSLQLASFALGADKIQTMFKIQLYHSRSGVFGACFISLARALGETMAVILIAGNAIAFPVFYPLKDLFFQSVRTLTGNIVLEASYASGNHLHALFATGVILFLFVSLLNIYILRLKTKGVKL